jgi:hypothetical protein
MDEYSRRALLHLFRSGSKTAANERKNVTRVARTMEVKRD